MGPQWAPHGPHGHLMGLHGVPHGPPWLVSGSPTFQGWGGGPRQPGWPPNRPTRLAAQHSKVEAAARLAQWRKKKIFFLCKTKIFFLRRKKIFFLRKKKKIFFLRKKKVVF